MPSIPDSARRRHRLGFGPILLANLVPLVGVARFGWDPGTLVVVYGLELLFTFPFAGVKALFARRSPRTDHDGSNVISVSSDLTETRGSIDLVPWLPPLYPRNLPFAAAVVNGAVWFLIAFGVVASTVVAVGDVLTRPAVLASVLALVVGQSVETWREYLRGGYRTASAYSVAETPVRQAFFLVVVLMITPGIAHFGVEGVFGAIVVGKLLVEWSAYRAGTDGTGRLADWLAGPEPTDADPDSVAAPGATPDDRIPTDRRAVLYTAVFDVVGREAPFLVVPYLVVWFLALAVLGDEASLASAVGVGVVVAVAFLGTLATRVLLVYLQYGHLEYRRYGDRIVVYDTLLAAPQWSAPIPTLRDGRVVPDRLADRLLGTRTVLVTTGRGDDETRRYLGPVTHGDRLVETFELPVGTVSLDPIDRRPAAVVVVCVVALGGAAVALAAGPWATLGEVLFRGLTYGIFGIPIVGATLRLLWVQAYPERTTDSVED